MALEIDLVVSDCEAAANFYRDVFGAEIQSLTRLMKGTNEGMLLLEGVVIHLLEENHQYHLYAPTEEGPAYMQWNLFCDDVEDLMQRAMEAGCSVVMPLAVLEGIRLQQCILRDPFGYHWILAQVLPPPEEKRRFFKRG